MLPYVFRVVSGDAQAHWDPAGRANTRGYVVTVTLGDSVRVEILAIEVDEFVTAGQDGDLGSPVHRNQ
jgi:hypothetical protein